ncbi:MAG: hypothetical protein H0X42_01960 [Solirubrobacterales bacterium]|nr:hypothetical protein [Solirubrobacterales bacterium]
MVRQRIACSCSASGARRSAWWEQTPEAGATRPSSADARPGTGPAAAGAGAGEAVIASSARETRALWHLVIAL